MNFWPSDRVFRAFVNNDVRYCRLTLASFDDDQKVLTIVQTVVNTCRNLKKLEIICEKDFDKDGEVVSCMLWLISLV